MKLFLGDSTLEVDVFFDPDTGRWTVFADPFLVSSNTLEQALSGLGASVNTQLSPFGRTRRTQDPTPAQIRTLKAQKKA